MAGGRLEGVGSVPPASRGVGVSRRGTTKYRNQLSDHELAALTGICEGLGLAPSGLKPQAQRALLGLFYSMATMDRRDSGAISRRLDLLRRAAKSANDGVSGALMLDDTDLTAWECALLADAAQAAARPLLHLAEALQHHAERQSAHREGGPIRGDA